MESSPDLQEESKRWWRSSSGLSRLDLGPEHVLVEELDESTGAEGDGAASHSTTFPQRLCSRVNYSVG